MVGSSDRACVRTITNVAQGDAFNRREVSSVYVGPSHRFVVSLIAGVDAEDPTAAAAAALGMTRYPGKSETVWSVHDRHTGETHEIAQGDFEDDDVVYVGDGDGEG